MNNPESHPQNDMTPESTDLLPKTESDTPEVSTQEIFDRMFPIDKKKDSAKIKDLMLRIKNTGPEGSFSIFVGNEAQYQIFREKSCKYTQRQIDKKSWVQADYDKVIAEIQAQKLNDYFLKIRGKYEWGGTIQRESNVRQDQKAEIYEDICDDKVVLIRSVWTAGKSSLVRSIGGQYFGRDNYTEFDLAVSESLDELINFINNNITGEIVNKSLIESGLEGEELDRARYVLQEKVLKQAAESHQSVLELFNSYLKEKDEKFLIIFDEIMGLQEEVLNYLASIRDSSQIKYAVVLHRISSREDRLKEMFKEAKTHFIRPITFEDTQKLIREPLKGTKVTFSDDAIQRILEFSGGRPFEINTLCRVLISPRSKLGNIKFHYGIGEIDSLIEKIKKLSVLNPDFRSQSHEYDEIFKSLLLSYRGAINDEERALMDRLALQDEISTQEIDETKVQPLINIMFVTKDENKGTYRVNGELLRFIIQNKKSLERIG